MDQSLHRLSDLAFKYLKGELNATESQELDEYLERSEDNRAFFSALTNIDRLNEQLEPIYAVDDKAMWRNVVAATPRLQKGRIISIRSVLKYAAVIFIAAIGAYWFISTHQKAEIATTSPTINPIQNEILPGGNKAILTLGNGQKIILDSAANGKLAQQGKTTIVKTSDKQLTYTTPITDNQVYYNTVFTPKGGQYQLILPDGSKVWINAASSLHFPTAFTGKERIVELDGEAYFEVTKNSMKPFRVQLKNGMMVQVLGTHFNIMAYGEEKEIKTTLLEGSVRVLSGAATALLRPGQQALVTGGNSGADIKVEKHADIDEAIAWKNGLFQFYNADIKAVMRQVARWYDVDIQYEGMLPEKRFTGKMSRNLKVTELLSGIEYVGVHFKIDGRKIIVLP